MAEIQNTGNNKKNGKKKVGSVLVVGAGISGIQASLDLSASGFRVYLIEEKPAVGGRMASLDKTFPTGDCATCIISPKLVECIRDINVDVFTMTSLEKVSGEAGNFTVTLKQQPRFVDVDKCTGCGDCTDVCPVEIPSVFDEGIGKRKATDKFYAQATPNANMITKLDRAPCSFGCPIDTSVQGYVALIAEGRFEEAAEVIRKENPLPSICGMVCFHPCESYCNRGELDEPVSICALKRFAIEKNPVAKKPKNINPINKTIAVIGSGPAGLAAAHSLGYLGYKVNVYESLPVLGGMMAVGIPDYRLPVDILERDINAIKALGVTFHTSTAIGEKISVDELKKSHDAIFISTGAHESRKLGITGEDSENVIHGIDFLRKHTLKEKVTVGKNVGIVGGGNTAIDAARTALRLGAKEVTIIYRRSRKEMPASEEEIEAALEEGIKIKYLTAPVEISTSGKKANAIKCVQMKLGAPDESGRRRPIAIEGSEFTLETDMIIPAISQSSDKKLSELFKLETTNWGTIKTDDLTLATSVAGIFAGGDVVIGPSSVIDAIDHGKRAAIALDNYLNERPLDEGVTKVKERANPLKREDLSKLKNEKEAKERIHPDAIEVKKRITNFNQVEKTFTDEQAKGEAARCLNCSACSECMMCVDACEANAIFHEDKGKTFDIDVGAILLTPGFTAFDAIQKHEYGVGYYQNVFSSAQFERIISASGPTGGHIVRASDGKHPKTLAFIQCVGSRDGLCGNDYCSSVCCMVSTKEAILAKEHEPDLDITVFYMDLRAFGKDFDRYYARAKSMGIKYVRCRPSSIIENKDTKNMLISYLDENDHYIEKEFEMVVLSIGLEPSATLKEQADCIGVALNEWGFVITDELMPLNTSKPGIFVGGAFQEPKDIPDTVMQASGAAAKAMAFLATARGTLERKKVYPIERDVTDEPPRVGVFVCHCGSNIASVVDVEKVVEAAKDFPDVVFAEHEIYVCADDSQDLIKEKIIENKLNRVVIASCTPRTHEPIFRDTLRAVGLNQYLLEMANIRDQCSWVHSNTPEKATQKAIDLVRMTVGRAVKLAPLKEEKVPVNNTALIVGGGIAGMSAAISLAEQGFPVHIVEKENQLGGTVIDMYQTMEGHDLQKFLADTIDQVNKHSRIKVHLKSSVANVDGHIGEFHSTIANNGNSNGQKIEIEHGVVIVATGAIEEKPTTYSYDKHDKILTQLELSTALGKNELSLPEKGTVVMVQCVEQRNEDRPYCSRVCCATAVKNALSLKKAYPDLKIMVLYRDMRTYGFRELAFQEARAKGIIFSQYDAETPPELTISDNIKIEHTEIISGSKIQLEPDMVVLASPIVPRANKEEISELLRVPLNEDGFFLEAHVKLRPVDFASEGLFICGTAHAPKFINETISQANAVAGRAATILSKKEMPVTGQTAWIDQDKCISCMTCVHVCPYNSPMINMFNKGEIQAAVCMGCGSCTAECPARAISLRNYTDNQIMSAIDRLLFQEIKKQKPEPVFPEKAGIAQPHWYKD